MIKAGQGHITMVAPASKGLSDVSLSNTFPRVTHKFAKHKLIGLPFSCARWLPGADCFSLLIWTKWSGCFWQFSRKKCIASAMIKFPVESYWNATVSVGCQTVGLGLFSFCLEREGGMSIQETYIKSRFMVHIAKSNTGNMENQICLCTLGFCMQMDIVDVEMLSCLSHSSVLVTLTLCAVNTTKNLMLLKYWNNLIRLYPCCPLKQGALAVKAPNPTQVSSCFVNVHRLKIPVLCQQNLCWMCSVEAFSLAFHPAVCSVQSQLLHCYSSPHKDQELQSGPNKHTNLQWF